MKRFSVAVALLPPLLAACSGGSASIPTPLAQTNAALGTLGQDRVASEAENATTQQAIAARGATDFLYVANTGNNSITVYRHAAANNAAPLYVIAGPKTGINSPGQLSQDRQGNLYVANGYFGTPGTRPAILVFAHGANGNVAPIRTLAGPLTGMHHVQAMTVDQTTGKLFVVDTEPDAQGADFFSSLLRFAPDASGNTAPFARSMNALNPANQIASDSTGQNIIEAHLPDSPNSVGYGVGTLPKQFPNDAQLTYLYDTTWFGANGVADDAATKTYLTTSDAGIYRFAENTTGEGPSGPGGQTFSPAPLSVISSDTCGGQLAVGYLRNIYVTHSTVHGCSADAVYVYGHNASGNATPIWTLSGSATQLSAPYGIYVGP